MLTIVIPTVESRAHLLPDLVSSCEALTTRSPVVVRHVEGTPPRVDPPRAFLECERASTKWALHLEDDAFLGPDARRIPEILDAAELDIVSFFALRDRPDGLTSIRPRDFSFTVAVAIRSRAAEGLSSYAAAWYDRHPSHFHASDLILRDFARDRGLRVAIHYPSLVQHRPVRSTLGARSTKRQSPSYQRHYGDV